MLLKYFYDNHLAHASYLVGCQRTGEAIIIDPARNVGEYVETAVSENLKIVAVAETHIHADYLSGARELAEQVDAKLYLSDEGDEQWKYEYVDQYNHQLVKDGDAFKIGNLRFEVIHTPGHTPESISFLLTDEGGGATLPMGIFTGDFVFVGAIGRPDLLEKAVGISGNAREGAYKMFHSLARFKALPDYLQVWPAHGAGSACGKGLGAIPSTTVGYEKRFNPGLSYETKEAFAEYILADQPEPPYYFKIMKMMNKKGPKLVSSQPQPEWNTAEKLSNLFDSKGLLIDTRNLSDFRQAHIPKTINLPVDRLASWAGWFVNYEQEVYLLTGEEDAETAVRILYEIGIDNIAGLFNINDPALDVLKSESYKNEKPKALASAILEGKITLIDVRAQTEWDEGHLPNAKHIMLGYLPEEAKQLAQGETIIVQCRSGSRSAIAASILQAAGAKEVINLDGGIQAWSAAGYPVI